MLYIGNLVLVLFFNCYSVLFFVLSFVHFFVVVDPVDALVLYNDLSTHAVKVSIVLKHLKYHTYAHTRIYRIMHK